METLSRTFVFKLVPDGNLRVLLSYNRLWVPGAKRVSQKGVVTMTAVLNRREINLEGFFPAKLPFNQRIVKTRPSSRSNKVSRVP